LKDPLRGGAVGYRIALIGKVRDFRTAMGFAVWTILSLGVAQADLLVTSSAALGPNDVIDWGQLGPAFTPVLSPVSLTSSLGLDATASTTDPAGLLRLNEGTGWVGNFSPGDRLLTSNTAAYFPLTVMFATPVFGAGANIQLDQHAPFTAFIEAFSGATSLGIFTEDGFSNGNEDGSAIFIGVRDPNAEITSVVFGLTTPTDSDFAINALRITEVPEPSSFYLLSGALFLFASGHFTRDRLRMLKGNR
jgi:hypothetical protein